MPRLIRVAMKALKVSEEELPPLQPQMRGSTTSFHHCGRDVVELSETSSEGRP